MNRTYVIVGLIALAATIFSIFTYQVIGKKSKKASSANELEDLNAVENVSAFTALYSDGRDSLRLTMSRIEKSCKPANDNRMRGIYVDFIYDPKYYFELSVLRRMLIEILQGNPHMPYYYDYDHYPNSTIITVGYEHMASRFAERSIITMKPKLLKDILYTGNIFDQIYNFLLSYFRSCLSDPTLVPEYDRTINFKRYRQLFADSLAAIDEHNQVTTICRNEELYNGANEGRVCLVPDVNATQFDDPKTAEYWTVLLSRLAVFMSELLDSTFSIRAIHDKTRPCYRIALRPEIDIRRVLLFPHAAVKTAQTNERLSFDPSNRKRIVDDIILFKHRVLHAFGVGHRYSRRAIMNSYDNDWQFLNLFGIMSEDYKAMARCYGNDEVLADLGIQRSPNVEKPAAMSERALATSYIAKKFVTDLRQNATTVRLLDLFISDFDKFMSEIRNK